MFARQLFLPIVLLPFISVGGLAAQDLGATRQNSAISVESLEAARVIGHLGHPLGSVVRVTGTAEDGKAKGDLGKRLLKVETVNGKRLEKPVYFSFNRAAQGIDTPDSETHFDYFVHEWGSFDGEVELPKELGAEEPGIAHDGFSYRREITIHKSNPVPQEGKPSGK
jgi:hypothetical protein